MHSFLVVDKMNKMSGQEIANELLIRKYPITWTLCFIQEIQTAPGWELDELVEKNISLKSQVNEKEKELKTMSSSSLSAKQITDVPYATIISSMIKRASTPIK